MSMYTNFHESAFPYGQWFKKNNIFHSYIDFCLYIIKEKISITVNKNTINVTNNEIKTAIQVNVQCMIFKFTVTLKYS